MRAIGLVLCGLLAACGGRPLISPALEQSAVRAALQASMAADEVATPLDDPDVLAIGDTADPRVALPVREPSISDGISEQAAARAASDEAHRTRVTETPAAEPEVADPAAAAGARLRDDHPPRDHDPTLVRALEQLTVELREQRLLTTMRLVTGERAADDSAASPAALAEIERAITRVEAAQEAQARDTAAVTEALDALRVLVEERVPSDVATRLGDLREAVRGVTPALEEIQREQEALRTRLERLESTPTPEPARAAQSFSLDELREALDAERAAEQAAGVEADEPPPDDAEPPQDEPPDTEGRQPPQDEPPDAEGRQPPQDEPPDAEGRQPPQDAPPEVDDNPSP